MDKINQDSHEIILPILVNSSVILITQKLYKPKESNKSQTFIHIVSKSKTIRCMDYKQFCS